MHNDKNPNREPFMLRVARGIVGGRKLILMLTAALLVFCAVASGWVGVENDLAAFLSEDSEARRGLKIMEDEFITYGTAEVMVEDVTPEQAQTLSETLAGLDGVAMVDYDETDAHYRDGAALYSVTFDAPEDDPACETALDGVRDALAEYDVSVSSDVGQSLSDTINGEMRGIIIIVVIVVVGGLVFTSQTYAEVLVMGLTFLAAALLHQGTNFLFGTISFISNAVSIVLQLALSLDYAVILCNRFKEEHEQYPIQEAAVQALSKSIPEVFSSSLTTIAGLLAMTFMQFRLGADLGFVLIKAIFCSLLSVFVLMPALLVIFGKWMDKTKHKCFVPKIPFVGRFAHATRHVIPPVFLVVFVAAFLLSQQSNFVYTDEILDVPKQNEQQLEKQNITDRFGETNVLAVVVPAGDYEKEAALLEELAACDEVDSAMGLANIEAMDGYCLGDRVSSRTFAALAGVDNTTAEALFAYYAAEHGEQDQAAGDLKNYEVPLVDIFLFLHDKADSGTVELTGAQRELIDSLYEQLSMAQDQLQGTNYSRLVLNLNLPREGDEAFSFIDRIHVIAAQYYDDEDVVTVGGVTNSFDFKKSFEQDNLIVNLMSLLMVMVILLFTFRSFGMPVLLILVIEGSICINFALAKLIGSDVFFMDYLIASAIQMGSNIDYAIVVSSRYAELRETMEPREAMIEAMNLAFPTIITSGAILAVAGLLIRYKISYGVISQLGLYVGVGAIITLVLVMFVLPQLLLFGEGFVRATTLKALPRLRVSHQRLRRVGCAVLTAASAVALVAAPLGLKTVSDLRAEQDARTAQLQSETAALSALAVSLDAQQARYDETKLSFAEHAVTDSVGQTQLSAGQAEYDAGAEKLASGQAEYDAAAARLAVAKQAYAEGQARLEAGQQQYDEGQAEYAAGQEKLDRVQPIYDLVHPLYANYQSLQQQYDAAVAAGDWAQAALLKVRVDAQRAAFETQLAGTGYSIESLIQEYEAGQAQLAEAETQLAAARQELVDGQAQLDNAAAQIADGERQLAAAKQQLDAGYAALDDAGGQLDAGRATLAANRAELAEDLQALDRYSDDETRLEAGVQRLMQEPDIADRAGKGATYAEICTAAQDYFDEDDAAARSEFTRRTVTYALLLAAAVLGLCAGLLGLTGRGTRGAALIAVLSTLLALAATLAGKTVYVRTLADGSGGGTLQFVAALALTVFALLAAEILRKAAYPSNAEAEVTESNKAPRLS
ncbi:MAG: MMPL family transporter [Oscillospiraceae bacterium]